MAITQEPGEFDHTTTEYDTGGITADASAKDDNYRTQEELEAGVDYDGKEITEEIADHNENL